MANGFRHYFVAHWRLLVLAGVIVVIFIILYALREAVWPFLLGLVVAYILIPPIRWLEQKLPGRKRSQPKRVILILLSYVLFFGLLGLLGFYVFTTVSGPFTELLNNAGEFTSDAVRVLDEFTANLRLRLPPEVSEQLTEALQQAGAELGSAISGIFLGGISLIVSSFGFIAGLAAIPFFLFFVLKDWERLGRGLLANLPAGAAEHTRNVAGIVENVIGRYVRSIFILSLTVGVLDYIGLMILDIEFAPALGLFAALTELIPIVGPWLGGAAGVIVVLATAPEKTLWVALLFFLVQQLENQFLVPRIQGAILQVHPAFAIVLLVVGTYIAGFWGLLLAVPIGALAYQIYRYIVNAARGEDLFQPFK